MRPGLACAKICAANAASGKTLSFPEIFAPLKDNRACLRAGASPSHIPLTKFRSLESDPAFISIYLAWRLPGFCATEFGKSSHISQYFKHHPLYNHSLALSNPKRWISEQSFPPIRRSAPRII
jgi:hypothetical protein